MQEQNRDMDAAMQRLSSGLRINTAADDAAGSAIASTMEAQIKSLGVAIRNSNDAISMTQTAEGALGEMENILQRVRELSVQAGNSTLNASDRKMIQSEVTALLEEIDSIASKTNFNGIKLLDGSSESLTFQTGINVEDSLKVNLQKADSQTLGLKFSSGVTEFTSERITKTNYSSASVAVGDVKLNGANMFASAFSTDLSSDGDAAKTLATAINANTGVHGAVADAFNSLTSAAKGDYNQTAKFTINSNTVELASSYAELVDNITESVSGVKAVLNGDNTITLSNTDGSEIVIAETSSGGVTFTGAADVGFTAGTYTGMYSLKNIDGSQVKIEAGNAPNGYTGGLGTISDVHGFGLNEVTAAGAVQTDVVNGVALVADELLINDVKIGKSESGQAKSIAAAINALTEEHGVTASAKTTVALDLNLASMPTTSSGFAVNGNAVDLTAAVSMSDIVTKVNAKNIGDVRASTNSDGQLVLTSASGSDIKVEGMTGNSFIRRYTDVAGTKHYEGIHSDTTYDADGLVTSTDIGAAGDYTINGALKDSTDLNGVIHIVSGAGDESGSTFTITGTDYDGNVQTETLIGPAANTLQVNGSKVFKTVTNINVDANAGAVTIGVHATGDDVDSLVTSTNIGAAGTYTIDGVLGDSQNLDAFITVTGAAAENSNTFVITGTDRFGNYQREEFTGSSTAGDTAVSTKRFGTITSIATEQDAGVVTIGTTRNLGNGTAAIVGATDIAAAGAYTLDGAYKDYTDLGAVIEFDSGSNDDSGRTFTIVGKGMLGQDLSETLTGGNATTVTSLNVYASITSIHADASTAGNVTIRARTAYDSFVARGNLELSTSTGTPVKIDTIAQDHIVGLAAGPSATNGADDTLQKIGAQSQSSEVQTIAQDLSVETLSNANKALDLIDDAIVTVSSFRSSFGAIENRLDAAINNLSTLKVNTQASQSRIQDADFASETTSLTKSQILAQAATSMLAQANASKQNLLALLQG
jgi:flagellin